MSDNKKINFSFYISAIEKEKIIQYKDDSKFNTLTDYVFNSAVNKQFFESINGKLEINPRRNKRITIRASQEEHDLIKRFADSYNLTESEYVRKRCLKQKVIDKKIIKERTNQIGLINKISGILIHPKFKNTDSYGDLSESIRNHVESFSSKPQDLTDSYPELNEINRKLVRKINLGKSPFFELCEMKSFLGVNNDS